MILVIDIKYESNKIISSNTFDTDNNDENKDYYWQ